MESLPLPATSRPAIERVVALGASNLKRGFRTLVSTATDHWGPEVELLVALGLGRSYGASSRFLWRTLPGILESGLWSQLAQLPSAPTRALVTDVGNDVMYGSSPAQILEWVEEAVVRLERHSDDILLTGLPLHAVRRLSSARFLFFRSLLVPQCRLSLVELIDCAEAVDAGLQSLAARRGARFFPLRPEWYGVDPVHIRPSLWREAWREVLVGEADRRPNRMGWRETARLHALPPERRWMMGREQVVLQTGSPAPGGSRLWVY